MHTAPVLFLAFANDQERRTRYLRGLAAELRDIREALLPLSQAHKVELVERANATLGDILDVFQDPRYQGRICLFHYGGHAESYGLLLESESGRPQAAFAEGLNRFLARQEGLHAVFLNGCSTHAQAQALHAAGVPTLIATASTIRDDAARRFAARLYTGLAGGASLAEAYRAAADELRIPLASEDYRSLYWDDEEEFSPLSQPPWRLLPDPPVPWRLLDQRRPSTQEFLTALPAAPPRYFLGRADELSEIERRLAAQEQQAAGAALLLVNGIGGIGKTALAQAYWQRQQQRYQSLAWINCPEGLLSGVFASGIEARLGLDEGAQLTEAARWDRLVQALATRPGGPHLLVLDNVNAPEDLEDYLTQRPPRWHILISSRARIADLELDELPIGELSAESARRLFLTHCPGLAEAQHKLLEELLAAIAYHTLTTELLAKHLRKIGPTQLPTLLRDLSEQGILGLPGQRKVKVAWQNQRKATPEAVVSAMYQLDDSTLSPTQRDLLTQLSVLPGIFIEQDLLQMLLAISAEARATWAEQLEALAAWGWLEPHPDQASYRLHPVIQEVIRLEEQPDYARCTALVRQLKTLLDGRKLGETRVILPYAQSVLHHLNPAHEQLGRLAWSLTDRFAELGQVYDALAGAEQMVYHFEKQEDIVAWGAAYNRKGNLHLTLGQMTEARAAYEQMADVCNSGLVQAPHSEALKNGLAISYSKLGTIYRAQGNFEQALHFFQKDFKLSEELFQANPHSEALKNGLAISYAKLGTIYKAQGNFEQALHFFQKDFKLSEELFQANPHSEALKNGLAISYSKLGTIYQAQGKFEQALHFFQKRAQLGEELFQANPHAEALKNGLAISYEKLGTIYKAQGKFEQALHFFQKETALFEELFQANPHSEALKNGLAISYEKLGTIYKAQGKFEQALDFFQKDLKLTEELFQANPHSEALKNGLAISYEKLGTIYQAQGNFEQAIDFFQKDLKLSEELFQANPHAEALKNGLAISYEKLGTIYQAQGNFEQALHFFQQYNQLTEELFQANPHAEALKNGLAISYAKLGTIYQAQGNFEQAIDFFQKDLKLSEELFQANPHAEALKNGLAISYSKLGEIYQAQGNFEQALHFFQQYNQLREELFQANPHSEALKNGLAISYHKLGTIYQAQGNFEQALHFFQKETALFEELFQANPHSEALKNGLAISYSKLGEIYQAQGNFEQALDFFQKETALFEELFQANPHAYELIKGRAFSYYKLGDLYREREEFEKARLYFEQAQQILRELHAQTGIPQLVAYLDTVAGDLAGLE